MDGAVRGLAARRERSAPILADLEPWLRLRQERLSRKSEVGKAIAYATKRWEPLTRFMTDGRICLSNNAAERALRGVGVGRRNWTFAGSDRGGERAAAIAYTLIETAMCGWPPRCKGEDDWLWRVVGGVHVSGLSEAATGPRALMRSADRVLIKLTRSRRFALSWVSRSRRSTVASSPPSAPMHHDRRPLLRGRRSSQAVL